MVSERAVRATDVGDHGVGDGRAVPHVTAGLFKGTVDPILAIPTQAHGFYAGGFREREYGRPDAPAPQQAARGADVEERELRFEIEFLVRQRDGIRSRQVFVRPPARARPEVRHATWNLPVNRGANITRVQVPL